MRCAIDTKNDSPLAFIVMSVVALIMGVAFTVAAFEVDDLRKERTALLAGNKGLADNERFARVGWAQCLNTPSPTHAKTDVTYANACTRMSWRIETHPLFSYIDFGGGCWFMTDTQVVP